MENKNTWERNYFPIDSFVKVINLIATSSLAVPQVCLRVFYDYGHPQFVCVCVCAHAHVHTHMNYIQLHDPKLIGLDKN